MFSIAAIAAEIGRRSKGRLASAFAGGAQDREVSRFAPLDKAGPDHVAFLAQPQWRPALKLSGAGVIVARQADIDAVWGEEPPGRALVVTEDPYAWFAWAAQIMTAAPAGAGRVDPRADVSPEACVDPSAVIDAFAVVKAGASIGPRVRLHSGAFVGEGTPVLVIFAALLLAGIGFGLFSSPNTNAIMSRVPPAEFSLANTIVAGMRTVGQTASMCLVTIIVSFTMGGLTLEQAGSVQLVSTVRICFIVFAVICAIGLLLSLARKS
ncbi:MAG: hypothetical protein HUK26_08215 [Duodenibacillus sp.]|nr:hypothetical protein [Duodenibacillus sp.]